MGRVQDGPEPSDSPELAEYLEQTELSVNKTLAEFTLLMKAHKVDEVHVVYGAGEDGGGIEDIIYYQRNKKKLVRVDGPPKIRKKRPWTDGHYEEDRIEGLMYSLMQARGFFNQNEGCQGVIRWAIDKDMIIHDHQTNTYGEGEETGEEWEDDNGVKRKERETLYIPNEIQTFWGIDDVERALKETAT